MMPTAIDNNSSYTNIREMAKESIIEDKTRQQQSGDYHQKLVLPGKRILNHPVKPHYGSLAEYARDHAASLADPEAFWAAKAREMLTWHEPFGQRVLEGDFHSETPLKWFPDGTLNVAENCVDRHVRAGRGDDVAIIWEGDEPGVTRKITFSELLQAVTHTAALLRTHFPHLKPGDTVTVYMPMIPETVFVMLACARLGLVHNVVFAGFSAEALRDRIVDAQSALVITAEFGMRGGKRIPLRTVVEEALKGPEAAAVVKHLMVYERSEGGSSSGNGNGNGSSSDNSLSSLSSLSSDNNETSPASSYSTHFYSQLAASVSNHDSDSDSDSVQYFPSEHPLFMLYTSGSTGRPKGLLHTSAGYLLYAAFTARNSFDLHRGDVFGCLADVGWITGHSYIVYGPLALGITTVLFESIPTYPTPSRYWDVVERLGITQLYTAPTVIRALRRFGDAPVKGFDLSRLRVLGSVGEPIGEDAWMWYWREIGNSGESGQVAVAEAETNSTTAAAAAASVGQVETFQGMCSVVDTFWQTETGGHVVAPLPAVHAVKPGAAGFPCIGIDAKLLDPQTGAELTGTDQEGVLVIAQPWPGMARSVFGDHVRFRSTYLQAYPGYYFTGDAAYRDQDGQLWIRGRVDDVINVSGHRMSTAEIEAVLGRHAACAEAAVLGRADEITGQSIWAFCIRKATAATATDDDEKVIKNEMIALIRKVIGPIATPRAIVLTPDLPKTRSGKIMRRLLRKMLAGEWDQLGDLSTLSNPACIDELRGLIEREDEKLSKSKK